MEVLPEDEIMLITHNGIIIRSPVSQVRVTGRVAQGVKLVQLDDKDSVVAVARVVPEDDDDAVDDDTADIIDITDDDESADVGETVAEE
jgi:DNA gyrase subunit A